MASEIKKSTLTSTFASRAVNKPDSRVAGKSSDQQRTQFPSDTVEIARNQRPVVLLHGTIVEKDGIAASAEYALRNGHPINHRTYPTIKNGGAIQDSAETASQEINGSRMDVAAKNLAKLDGASPIELREFFQVDGSLYGKKDKDAGKIAKVLPGVVESVKSTLKASEQDGEKTFSRRIASLESNLAADLKKSGLDDKKAKAASREIFDSITPRAIVVGHSAGGFVAKNVVLNPEPFDPTAPILMEEDDPFAYDAGHGVGQAIILSSPVGKGLSKDTPPGIAGLPYHKFEENFIKPMENQPMAALANLNPMLEMGMAAAKSMLSTAMETGTRVSLSLTTPFIHATKPGYEQIQEGSSFMENYMKKPIPEGVSVMGFTSPLDQLSQEERSKVDTTKPNGHTLSVDIGETEERIAQERPTWTHVLMTEKPELFSAQYAKKLITKRGELERVLDPVNDDGARYQALSMVQRGAAKNPKLLKNTRIKKAIQKVADEQMPFKDSPSYLAHQLLKGEPK